MEKTSNVTRIIEAITGIGLIAFVAYSIYICAASGVKLPVIQFMLCCDFIVLVGFGVATLMEFIVGKAKMRQDIRPLFEPMRSGLVLLVLITVICLVINFIV